MNWQASQTQFQGCLFKFHTSEVIPMPVSKCTMSLSWKSMKQLKHYSCRQTKTTILISHNQEFSSANWLQILIQLMKIRLKTHLQSVSHNILRWPNFQVIFCKNMYFFWVLDKQIWWNNKIFIVWKTSTTHMWWLNASVDRYSGLKCCKGIRA